MRFPRDSEGVLQVDVARRYAERAVLQVIQHIVVLERARKPLRNAAQQALQLDAPHELAKLLDVDDLDVDEAQALVGDESAADHLAVGAQARGVHQQVVTRFRVDDERRDEHHSDGGDEHLQAHAGHVVLDGGRSEHDGIEHNERREFVGAEKLVPTHEPDDSHDGIVGGLDIEHLKENATLQHTALEREHEVMKRIGDDEQRDYDQGHP